MHVLTAPATQDPRPGGFNRCVAGELLYRPFVCDSGQAGRCGCERSMAGMTTQKGTTLAEVAEKDMTPDEYVDTFAAFLVDTWGWARDDAEEEARILADIAADYPAGTLVTIQLTGDSHEFDEVEV